MQVKKQVSFREEEESDAAIQASIFQRLKIQHPTKISRIRQLLVYPNYNFTQYKNLGFHKFVRNFDKANPKCMHRSITLTFFKLSLLAYQRGISRV